MPVHIGSKLFFFVKNSHVRLLRSLIFRGGRCVIMANLLRCYRHSGLVMYFSTLPAPSASAPCILAILTHLRVRVKICILTHPHENPPEGRASGGETVYGFAEGTGISRIRGREWERVAQACYRRFCRPAVRPCGRLRCLHRNRRCRGFLPGRRRFRRWRVQR